MKKILILIITVFLAFWGTACSEKQEKEKISDLAYTIVREQDIPQGLADIIESRKQQVFKLTYEDDGSLYIACGYGQKESGGYSIQVRQLYLSKNAVYFDTELVGPKKEELNTQAAVSYPYIVIKTERREEAVVFQ